MTGEGKQHRGRQVLGDLMFREGANEQSREIALRQSVLEIDKNSRPHPQAIRAEQGLQFGFRIRVDHHEQVSALCDVGANAVLFLFRDLIARAGEHQYGGVVRYGRIFQQRQGADVIALFDQRLFRQGQAVSFLIFQAAFTVAF